MSVGHVCVPPPVLRGWVGWRHLVEGVRGLRHTKLWEESQKQTKVHMDAEARKRSNKRVKKRSKDKRFTHKQFSSCKSKSLNFTFPPTNSYKCIEIKKEK